MFVLLQILYSISRVNLSWVRQAWRSSILPWIIQCHSVCCNSVLCYVDLAPVVCWNLHMTCDYCGITDDIAHFFKNCPKVNEFWLYWINWWEHLSGIGIESNPILEECITFGFPLNSDAIQDVLNFCLLYTKYYIPIHLLCINFNKTQATHV